MPGDDLFKRYLEIGASVVGMSRERAESIVKDLVASGEVARGQAAKAADWLVERSRSGTEELAELVRREIREQVAALGLATKDDIARLEAKLAGPAGASGRGPTEAPTTSTAPGAVQTVAAAKRRVAADGAGISRSASARRRPGGSGPGRPDPAPPAGGAVPSKG